MSVSKAQIKQVRSLQQKKFRDELGLFVAEGDKCVEELQKGFELVALYREGENATRVEIEQMSGLQTPQGTIAVFRKPILPLAPSLEERAGGEVFGQFLWPYLLFGVRERFFRMVMNLYHRAVQT